MSKIESLQDLFVHELKDVYSAEKQLLKALPKMAKAAASEELRAAFEEHLAVTEKQVERLEQVFDLLDMAPRAKKCEAMEGLIKEGEEIIKEKKNFDPDSLNAALIAGAQKVEHYEIATYGTLRTWAKLLGHSEAAKLLQQTLDEEGDADKELTGLSEQINVEAAEPAEVG